METRCTDIQIFTYTSILISIRECWLIKLLESFLTIFWGVNIAFLEVAENNTFDAESDISEVS